VFVKLFGRLTEGCQLNGSHTLEKQQFLNLNRSIGRRSWPISNNHGNNVTQQSNLAQLWQARATVRHKYGRYAPYQHRWRGNPNLKIF